jgi:hypothetical protein
MFRIGLSRSDQAVQCKEDCCPTDWERNPGAVGLEAVPPANRVLSCPLTAKKSPQVGLLLFLTPFAFPLTITLAVPLVVVIVILALAFVLFLGVLHHVLMVELVGMARVETDAHVGSKA